MELIKKNNIRITGEHRKPILTDIIFSEETKPKPIVIFCHGYKGFKDWGAWHLMAEEFAEKGYFFLKFNFSHNGTSPDNLTEFMDIEAFGDNNYSKELDDLQSVIDWLFQSNSEYSKYLDTSNITLIGHSRGGGISIIKASEESRITKLVTFSSVSDFASRFPSGDILNGWEKKGVSYIVNTRTKQQLPHHFQFYTNFKANEKRLTISRATKALKVPHLIVHGSKDTSVPLSESGKLFEWSPSPELLLVEGADHVYDLSHPWNGNELPSDFRYVLDKTFKFIAK
ncbi:MAG TPA: alpha/beta fold hydrolase [Gillisia sp.]|nr:alpha/beta fold hydrolase [Gillisia sp.]